MSQDDGVYVLQTKGPQFRIAHMQNVVSLFDDYNVVDKTWTPNILTIVQNYATSVVYESLDQAWDAASNMEDDLGGTEYGTNLITDFKDYSFSDFEKEYETIQKSKSS